MASDLINSDTIDDSFVGKIFIFPVEFISHYVIRETILLILIFQSDSL